MPQCSRTYYFPFYYFFDLFISYSLHLLLYFAQLFLFFFICERDRVFKTSFAEHIQIRIRTIFRVKIFTRLPVLHSDSREYYGRETNNNHVYYLILVRNDRYVSIVAYFE